MTFLQDVLIVEDDFIIRDSLKQLLEYEGYRVALAGNGLEGLQALKASIPQLIILDLKMPIMDGWEFNDHLKANPLFAAIPIVMMSADATEEHRARDLTVQSFLKKPIKVNLLLKAVKACCGRT